MKIGRTIVTLMDSIEIILLFQTVFEKFYERKNMIFIYRCKMYKHKSVPKYFIQDSKWETQFDMVVGVKTRLKRQQSEIH